VGADQSVRHPIFARFFDRFAAKDEERGQAGLRQELLRGLSGRVIELGAAIESAGYTVESCRGFKFPPGARFSPVAPRIVGVARR
jgi:hypothetical protein